MNYGPSDDLSWLFKPTNDYEMIVGNIMNIIILRIILMNIVINNNICMPYIHIGPKYLLYHVAMVYLVYPFTGEIPTIMASSEKSLSWFFTKGTVPQGVALRLDLLGSLPVELPLWPFLPWWPGNFGCAGGCGLAGFMLGSANVYAILGGHFPWHRAWWMTF